MRKVLLALVLCGGWNGTGTLSAQSPSQPERPFHLQTGLVRIPFIMAGDFLMIPAQVDGTPGSLMFDTGEEQSLSLNDHLLKIGPGKVVGHGFTGSGQQFEVTMHPVVPLVVLGPDLSFSNVPMVISENLSFMEEHIDAKTLGILGSGFFTGYAVKINFATGDLTFYKTAALDSRASGNYLDGEKLVTSFDFQTRKLPNHPIFEVKVGDIRMFATLDTGQSGSLRLGPATRASLLERGLLVRDPNDADMFSLKGLQIAPGVKVDVKNVSAADSYSKAFAQMGITEDNVMQLGTSFLRQFTTVWDFSLHKIYILEPKKTPTL